jgi:hypothetical protein
VVRRRLSAASGSCSESQGNSGLGQQGGAARGSRGVPGVQETARSAVSCTGLRGASSNSIVFPRVSSLRHEA